MRRWLVCPVERATRRVDSKAARHAETTHPAVDVAVLTHPGLHLVRLALRDMAIDVWQKRVVAFPPWCAGRVGAGTPSDRAKKALNSRSWARHWPWRRHRWDWRVLLLLWLLLLLWQLL